MLNKLINLFVFCFCMLSFAQEPIRFTTKQGLPSNHVYDIQEDANGFMWFATNRGLVKFDGETFKNYNVPKSTMSILKDSKGTIWLGCAGGLFRINSKGIVNVTTNGPWE